MKRNLTKYFVLLLILGLFLGATGCNNSNDGNQSNGSNDIQENNDNEPLELNELETRLETALNESKPIFIEFYADRCPACTKMKPIITELEKEYGQEIEFILADTDRDGAALAAGFQVMYIPAYAFIDSQGQLQGELSSGVMAKEKLEEALKDLL